jgi:hypothetical protein
MERRAGRALTMAEPVTLTLAEAAAILEPPVTEEQLRAIITALRWKPDGYRLTGRSGRPTNTYNATRLMQLHASLIPFLTIDVV